MKLEILYVDNSYKALKIKGITLDALLNKLIVSFASIGDLEIKLDYKLIKEVRLDDKLLFRYDGYVKELDKHVYTIKNKI